MTACPKCGEARCRLCKVHLKGVTCGHLVMPGTGRRGRPPELCDDCKLKKKRADRRADRLALMKAGICPWCKGTLARAAS